MKTLPFLYSVILCVCCITTATADYLITSRKTSLKAEANSQSEALVQVETSTVLLLLDDGTQTNGYYHVQSGLIQGDGWIYRTFVRRHAGSIPASGSSGGVTTKNTSVTGNVNIRVLDVGPGLCNLIKLPNGKYIIYDAGHWRGNGNTTLNQIKAFIPEGSEIELMILSHTDSDHIGAAGNILDHYKVKKVLWGGYERSMANTSLSPSATYNRLVEALEQHPETENVNLHERDSIITPGTRLKFGNATLTFLCGFGEPLPSWGLTDQGEKLNAVSIVMKLDYQGKSVLFCGDAVGRHRGDPANALLATEHYLVNNASQYLPSTIVLAPHHGADNGSSTEFVKRTKPETVIFSAGHDFSHPTLAGSERYLLGQVKINNMYRTDRGDDEGIKEWPHLRVTDCKDGYGDDDLHIEIMANGQYRVSYLNPDLACEEIQ